MLDQGSFQYMEGGFLLEKTFKHDLPLATKMEMSQGAPSLKSSTNGTQP